MTKDFALNHDKNVNLLLQCKAPDKKDFLTDAEAE